MERGWGGEGCVLRMRERARSKKQANRKHFYKKTRARTKEMTKRVSNESIPSSKQHQWVRKTKERPPESRGEGGGGGGESLYGIPWGFLVCSFFFAQVYCLSASSKVWLSLDEVCHVHRHLLNLGVVELLNVAEVADIFCGDKVDGNTLTTKTTRSSNSVDVKFTVLREIIANDQWNLLNVKASAPDICSNEHTRLTSTEFRHNCISLFLRHASMHVWYSEIGFSHLFGKPLHSVFLVTEDYSLSNGQSVV